jgi:hypothetical protein
MKDLTNAIRSLYPDAEFSLWNEDYETIIWHKIDAEPPSLEELEAEADRLAELASLDRQNRQEARLAILERLGLTEDEAKLILG